MAQQNASASELESDIERTRARLAATIDELAYRVAPGNLAKRQMESAKVSFNHATRTNDGQVRYEVVGPVLAVVAGLVALAIYRRVRA